MNDEKVILTMTKAEAAIIGMLIGRTSNADIEELIRENDAVSEPLRKIAENEIEMQGIYEEICKIFEPEYAVEGDDGEVFL